MSYTYRTQFPNARFLVLVLDNEPIGRLIVDTDAERVYLVDIALMPQFHGRGTGHALLQELQRQASALGVPVTTLIEQLEPEGVKAFEKSFEDLLATLETRRAAMASQGGPSR